jgi:hypothetical protein
VGQDLAVYDYARAVGDMSLMDAYADMVYRSDGDYLDVLLFPFSDKNNKNEILIMHNGGGLTETQEYVAWLGFAAKIGQFFMPNSGMYQGVVSIISEEQITTDAIIGISGGIADNISDILGKTFGAAIAKTVGKSADAIDILQMIKEMSDYLSIAPTNYVTDGYERYKMRVLEENFIGDLSQKIVDLESFKKSGMAISRKEYVGGGLGNLSISGIKKPTQMAMLNIPHILMEDIMNIINTLLNDEKYKDKGMEIYFKY